MKIAFLAGCNTVHARRWVNSLCAQGHQIDLFTLHPCGGPIDPMVNLIQLPIPPPYGYYLNAPLVRYFLHRLKPDLLNAHYASGYGTLGRLSGFHPYVLSVWGSDIYDFPGYSTKNRRLVIKNLRCADTVCSTSRAMAAVTRNLYPDIRQLEITPFGIDTSLFIPDRTKRDPELLTIGTVKKLEKKYGIDILIKSFALMRKKIGNRSAKLAESLRLLIVGTGSEMASLVKLAKDCGVDKVAVFQGAVPHEFVPDYLQKMDIYAAFSRLDSESFGVAILEASGCGLPVVVSNVDGPAEVVKNGQTGYIVQRENVDESATALERLVLSSELRNRLGAAGRLHVTNTYEWNDSVAILTNVYQSTISRRGAA